MKKVKILGIGNEGKFNYIIVRKQENFFEWLGKVMYNSFEAMPDVDKEEYINKNDKFVFKKKDIRKYIDKHESFEAEGARIDIFYGKENVFISIIASLKNRKKLMDNLEKYSEFAESGGDWKSI